MRKLAITIILIASGMTLAATPTSAQEVTGGSGSFFREAAAGTLGALGAAGLQFAISRLPNSDEPLSYEAASGMGATLGYRLGAGGRFSPQDLVSDRRTVVASVLGVVVASALAPNVGKDSDVDIPTKVLVSAAQGAGAALFARILR